MDKKISELDQALQINNDAVFPISQDNGGTDTTYKVSITQISAEVGEDQTFSNLDTTDKTLVGAINEISQGGGGGGSSTLAGLTDVDIDDQTLSDGQVLKYDSVEEKWKNDDVGAGGTTDYEDLSNKPQVNSVELVGNKSLDDLGIMPASLSKTVSGSIAHITDGGDNIPVKSLVSQIVAVESGNGQPKSPSNPYTISGFANGVVSVCGVNLWDEDYELGFWNASGVFSPNTSGYMSSKTHIPVKPNTSICVVIPNNISFYLCRYDKDKNFIDRLTLANPSQRVVQMTSETFYITFSTYQAYGTTYNNNISINYPSTDTQYHAYNGNTYTFAFGQTVCGGRFDNKGNLVVTHIFGELVASSKNGNYFRATLSELGLPNIYDRNADLLCDRYAVADVTTTTSNNNQITVYGDVGDPYAIRWVDLDYINADVVTYNTAMANNKPQICYKLLEPIILSITSQDIPTLSECNIFSNCGDVEINYYTDNADEIVEVVRHHYSTDEQVVGAWIDGSTLYEKTISFTTPSDSNYTQQPVDLLTAEIDKIWIFDGFTYKGDISASVMPYAYTNTIGNEQFEGFIYRGSTNITFDYKVGNQLYEAPAYVTIRYTKSST